MRVRGTAVRSAARRRGNSPVAVALICVIAAALIVTALLIVLLPKDERKEELPPRVTFEDTRAVYVATVSNINFPSRPDLTAEELASEMDLIVETSKSAGMNTVILQVRPSCDAFYKSDIFPVSRYLSSSGVLTLDCLEYMTEKCHENGMALWAWINPYRISSNGEVPTDGPAAQLSEFTVDYNGKISFDPSSEEVMELICDGVTEILSRYPVDGVIFDDYFYPYVEYVTAASGEKTPVEFDDRAAFEAVEENFDSVGDFRRDNVDRMVEKVHLAVKEKASNCPFGIAPFGIWKNNNGSNGGSDTRGLQSYSAIYCDTVKWIENGWVDFVAPQIYWDCESTAANYRTLVTWWNGVVAEANEKNGTDISFFVSHAAYKYQDTFLSGEMTEQLFYAEAFDSYKGSLFYSYAAIAQNTGGVTEEIREHYFEKDAASAETES